MGFNLVRLAPGDVDAAAVGLPARNTRGIVFVGISDALVVLLTKLVLIGVRIRIAPAPELFNKALALVVGFEFLKGLTLFIGNDVSDVLV